MAIPVTDTQGTKTHLVATTVATSNITEIESAIVGGETINCLQTIGDIGSSRAVAEYGCIDSDETAKSLGSITLPNFETSLLFDALDTTGQADLAAMYANNTRRKMILELNDNAGTSPTYIVFECAVSSELIGVEKDAAVLYKTTIEITSNPIRTNATV